MHVYRILEMHMHIHVVFLMFAPVNSSSTEAELLETRRTGAHLRAREGTAHAFGLDTRAPGHVAGCLPLVHFLPVLRFERKEFIYLESS